MGTQINQLTEVTACDGSQQVPVYDPANGDARKFSLTKLLSWLQTMLTLGRAEEDSQYASPAATGFSVSILGSAGDHDVHLILTPAAGYAAGTLVLPPVAGLRDKQQVIVNCTQAVTTLTINGNGAVAVTGAPTTLAANAYFKLQYDLLMSTWYRID